jgi:mannose-6-phosphate isomerase-like protein (cupin superfamily)
MTVRVGNELVDLSPGGVVEVPAGTVHGFINTGIEPLVAEVDLVFTSPGHDPKPSSSTALFETVT